MKWFVAVAFVVAWHCDARADTPAGITQRLVRFIFDGCDYLTAHSPEPHRPNPPDRMLAAHFGHITKSEIDGARIRYSLSTRAFPGWEVSYFARGLDINFPTTIVITMGDLQKLLGPDDAPDVDYAVSASEGSASEVEDREFKPKREDYCYVTVRAEANRRKGAARRVFSLHFLD